MVSPLASRPGTISILGSWLLVHLPKLSRLEELLGMTLDYLSLCLWSKFLFCLALNFLFCFLNSSVYDHVSCMLSGS